MDSPVKRPSRTTKLLATLTTLAMAGVACGHSKPAATTGTQNASSTTSAASADPGTFGSMKNICGPGTGKTVPSTARGVTATTIKIGVLNDATSNLAPGLGAVYLDVAKAFTKRCNAAGGINGRKIEFVSRDAKITEAAARVVDACQSDFMLVGGGTPFDAPTVAPREKCKLGSIPAYAASPEATTSKYQALPTRVPATEANIALIRLLKSQYGAAFEKTGMVAVDIPSLLDPAQAFQKALPQTGARVVSFQKIGVSDTNYRNYIQPMNGKVEALIPPPAPDAGFFRAISDVGFKPTLLMDPIGNTYGQDLLDAFKDSPIDVPYYLASEIYPLEMADKNPTTKLVMDLTKATGTKQPIDAAIIPPWASWMLFASAASACTEELTMECVIKNATADKAYTAGGLIAPVDLSDPTAMSVCRVIQQVTTKGFVYDRKLTQPTKGDGVFNCDPANVVKIPS